MRISPLPTLAPPAATAYVSLSPTPNGRDAESALATADASRVAESPVGCATSETGTMAHTPSTAPTTAIRRQRRVTRFVMSKDSLRDGAGLPNRSDRGRARPQAGERARR